MRCDEFRDRLGDDRLRRLDATAEPAVAQHLEQCTECRADWEAALAVAPRVATLPRSLVPERDLWSGIETRIHRRRSRIWMLLAASIALILIPAAVLLRGGARAALDPGVAAMVATYQDAADELQRSLQDASPTLGLTLSVQLKALDAAIRESAGALRQDPENPAARALLLSAHRKKLHLLRQASVLAAEG
jgi:predicted anti-sigma-YlaC factor YlaD